MFLNQNNLFSECSEQV